MVDPREESLELVPSRYDDWREAFLAERDRIRGALEARDLGEDCDRIEHVGSTAVPGLAAKDVVAADAVEPVGETLESDLGGTRFENSPEWHPIHREHDGQRFNVHVFAGSGDGRKVSVVTREMLRADPGLREEYERLKRDLAADHDNLAAYSRGKTGFVDRLLERARADDLEFGFEVPGE